MPNDMIRLAMDQAAESHGSQDLQFTGRRFYEAFCRIMNVSAIGVDENLVRTVLAGRKDCELLGAGKYRVKVLP